VAVLVLWATCVSSAQQDAAPRGRAAQESSGPSPVVQGWQVTPTALVSRDSPPRQRIDVSVECAEPVKTCVLSVWSGARRLAEKTLGPLDKGANSVSVLLKHLEHPLPARWVLTDGQRTLAERSVTWNPPRTWTLYVIKSAWLKAATPYHYRVAAADADARQSDVSQRVQATTSAAGDAPPANVGTAYTGLISDPRAWRGDAPDILYVQWGQNTETTPRRSTASELRCPATPGLAAC